MQFSMLSRLRFSSSAIMSTKNITLYSSKICPYAHRVELALEEIGATYQRCEIDLHAKPEWYAPRVNAASKVPAIAYGGPEVPPDQPSPESLKINESLILLDFVNDIDPEHRLLPKDPETRARVRLFIDAVGSKLAPKWYLSSIKGDSLSNLMEGLDTIRTYLSPDTKFAVGDEFTLADIAILPFLARASLSLKYDVGAFPMGVAPAAYESVKTDEKFAVLRRYFNTLRERDSFKKTFNAEALREHYVTRFNKRETAQKL